MLYDESEKVFKMWYRTARPMVKAAGGEVPYTSGAYSFEDVPGYVHPEGAYRACYAVSSDGLSWKKPDLAMVDFEGSTRNNIIPPDVGAGAKGEVRRPNLIKDYDDPDLASVAGTPVRLRFHLNNAALYSFRIGGDSAPPGPFDLNLHAPGNRGRP